MDFVPFQLNINGKLFDLSTPQVMAIVNATPNSFYAKSRVNTDEAILDAVNRALTDGATIIDLGAYSTHPKADAISNTEEIERLENPLKLIRENFPDVIISLDTFRADVARWAVEKFDVNIINDVSGGTLDDAMFETVADLQVPYILMHMRGTHQTMQQLTDYDNMMAEIMEFFEKRINRLVQLGVKDIIVDPGFGFAKTTEQNYELLAKMGYFKEFGFPILYGISRKSMIYNLLGTSPEEALNGTTALNILGLVNGADILRVHDAREAVEAVKIYELYKSFQD